MEMEPGEKKGLETWSVMERTNASGRLAARARGAPGPRTLPFSVQVQVLLAGNYRQRNDEPFSRNEPEV